MTPALSLWQHLKTNKAFVFLLLIIFAGCQRVDDSINPQIKCFINDDQINHLEPAFPKLTYNEKQQEWGKEYTIGVAFARDLDFYRSITALKRAKILMPEDLIYRKAELEYFIILSYYLGGKYQEAIDTFDHSELSHISETFPAYKDLLLMLYESFLQTSQAEKADFILELIKQKDPRSFEKLLVYKSIVSAKFDEVLASNEDTPLLRDFRVIAKSYEKEKKSPLFAQSLNALIPGSGFLYVGQKQSAITSFFLNGLFIAAAGHFFSKGNIAAGVITTSFEMGWYFGGIYGAGEAAKLYNERLYENKTQPLMKQKNTFPILMLEHAF